MEALGARNMQISVAARKHWFLFLRWVMPMEKAQSK